jgi:hypothetical protein
MAKDQSIQTPEMQRKLGGSEAPGNNEDPVDATIHGGCGLPLVATLAVTAVLLLR